MASLNDWILLMKKVPLFASFTGKELTLVAKKMTMASYPRDALLVKEAAEGDTFYLVVSGSARIFKKTSHGGSSGENQSTIAYVSRGDAFGEMSLLTSEPYPYTVRIESTAEVLVLKKRDFDELLEQNPHLAVHVSRILSSHLATLNRGETTPVHPGRILPIMTALSNRDQVLFSVNLGVAMVEQTRQKILLFVVDDGSNLLAKSLGLDAPEINEETLRNNSFRDPDKFAELVGVHPSGLEVVSVPKKIFYALGLDALRPLVSLLRSSYDYCLTILPPHFNETVSALLNDSNQVVFVQSPESESKDLNEIRKTEHSLSVYKQKEKIWLKTQPHGIPHNIPPSNLIPWDADWGRRFMIKGSPFIPFQAEKTRRKIDRLARYFGQKLVGFAMGSGAAFGYSLIGILRVLENAGIYPDVISGTSMGALIGSFYASGFSPDDIEKISLSMTKRKLWRLANFTIPRSGILSGRGILKFLRSHLKHKTFNDLEIPFSCVATDIQTGREIVLEEGNVAEAVRASLSLPVFFNPYYLNGRYLVDGGLVNPVPTSIIMSQGANILISANLTSKTMERRKSYKGNWEKRLPHILKAPSIFSILMKTIYTMQYEIASSQSKMAHVVIDINAKGFLWLDLDRASSIIKAGEAAAEEHLTKIKSLLPYFSDSCKVRLTPPRTKNPLTPGKEEAVTNCNHLKDLKGSPTPVGSSALYGLVVLNVVLSESLRFTPSF